ncbi:MAG: hypothetical protein JRJ87_03990 [Deltaproteobacteria bacterium]|nr:hypothetical protein [Deltaproteobacteria bacterium]
MKRVFGLLSIVAVVFWLAGCSSGQSAEDAGDGADGAMDGGDGAADGNDSIQDDGGGELPPGTLSEWSFIGPPGGDRFLVRVDPFNPERVVVVGHGGVHRSSNRGNDWEAVHEVEMQGSLFGLAFDPTTQHRLAVGSNRTGVFVSDDFGASWAARSSGLPAIMGTEYFHEVQSLAFTNDGRLWACVRGADGVSQVIHYSDDQGRSWTASPGVAKGDVTQLFVAGTGLYAVSSSNGPYRYTGGIWESLAGNLPAAALSGTYLAVDPGNPDRVFLGSSRDGLYFTTDGGISWSRLDLPAGLSPGDPYPLVYFVVIDAANPDVVWVGLYNSERATESPLFQPDPDQVAQCGNVTCAGIYVSIDGGASWTHRIKAPLGGFRLTLDPSDPIIEPFGPRSRYFYLTSGGMACVIRSDDGGLTLCRRIQGINGVYINALRKLNGRIYSAGEQGITYSEDLGTSWMYRRPAESIVYTWDMLLDPEDSDTLLWATGEPAWGVPEVKGVWRSDLSSCQETMPTCSGDPPLIKCPAENLLEGTGTWRLLVEPIGVRRVFALTQEAGIKTGTGRDTNWADLSQGLAEQSVTSLLFDTQGEPWLAGTRTCRGDYTPTCSWIPRNTEVGGVYFFANNLWNKANGLDAAVLDLAHDRIGGTVYAATATGVARSLDSGRNWEPAVTGLPELAALRVTRSVVTDPRSPGVVYAGCLDGVYRSVDGGDQWFDAADGLLNRVTDRMIFVAGEPDRLFVATLGGSIFMAEIVR